eukprot:6565048-Alexandrium_andersonii.AAC.1
MSASLVGSEMCIRDRVKGVLQQVQHGRKLGRADMSDTCQTPRERRHTVHIRVTPWHDDVQARG